MQRNSLRAPNISEFNKNWRFQATASLAFLILFIVSLLFFIKVGAAIYFCASIVSFSGSLALALGAYLKYSEPIYKTAMIFSDINQQIELRKNRKMLEKIARGIAIFSAVSFFAFGIPCL